MPEPEHRELPPELAAEDEEPVTLDLDELARVKAKITAGDPMLKALSKP